MDLKFKYTCHFCKKEIRMNANDIINFIGKRYGTPDGDQLEDFFKGPGTQYNLCPKCAIQEGFEAEEFEGYEED